VGSLGVDPQQTKCGDGVVDTGNKAANAEQLGELCDDANANDGDGCSKDCKIELGWSCTKTALGDRKSVCTKVGARDLFMKKIDAVIYGKCYPGNYKSGAWNCDKESKAETNVPANADEKVTVQEKMKLLGKIATALTDLFKSII
jgi:cysteine-rich repeat protein